MNDKEEVRTCSGCCWWTRYAGEAVKAFGKCRALPEASSTEHSHTCSLWSMYEPWKSVDHETEVELLRELVKEAANAIAVLKEAVADENVSAFYVKNAICLADRWLHYYRTHEDDE